MSIAPRHAEARVEERLAVARVDVVDAEQEAAAAHLPHQLAALQRVRERVAQRGPALGHPLHEPVPAQVVDHGQPDRALQRRPAPRVAELEGARAAGHGGEDGLACTASPRSGT